MLRNVFGIAVMSAFASTAHAEIATQRDAFVESNVIAIFYHELGHAVIDLMQVPIFGQEEDAADVMSVLLIDWLYEEEAAQSMAFDSAFGYINDPEGTQEVSYWDLHGPDEQRFFNHVCLFYGANPDDREDLAYDLGLPEERAETCPEEFDLASDSWGGVFDAMDAQDSGVPMTFIEGEGEGAALLNRLMSVEVAAMNDDFKLPQAVEVRVENCGEPNAFYDPSDRSLIMCTEFVGHLGLIYDNVIAQ